jgi:hypothetical protein
VDALRLLLRLSLFPIVFALPPQLATVAAGGVYGARCVGCAEATASVLRSCQGSMVSAHARGNSMR